MTPDKLRSRVVMSVVYAIIGLAFGLYLLVGLLLWRDQEATLPGELWLAAGIFGGALVGFLSNSKGGQEGGTTGPLEVKAPPGEPLAVRDEGSVGSDTLVGLAIVVAIVLAIVILAQT